MPAYDCSCDGYEDGSGWLWLLRWLLLWHIAFAFVLAIILTMALAK